MNRAEAKKAQWADPAMRAKYLAIMERTKEKRLANHRVAMADPKVKALRALVLKALHEKKKALQRRRAAQKRAREARLAIVRVRDPFETAIFG